MPQSSHLTTPTSSHLHIILTSPGYLGSQRALCIKGKLEKSDGLCKPVHRPLGKNIYLPGLQGKEQKKIFLRRQELGDHLVISTRKS